LKHKVTAGDNKVFVDDGGIIRTQEAIEKFNEV
jgi:hypothetical protein